MIPRHLKFATSILATAAITLGCALAEIERRVIEATLERQGGSVPRAARVLEISPSTLYRKIEGWAKS